MRVLCASDCYGFCFYIKKGIKSWKDKEKCFWECMSIENFEAGVASFKEFLRIWCNDLTFHQSTTLAWLMMIF